MKWSKTTRINSLPTIHLLYLRDKNDISKKEFEKEKEKFFSVGQACLRSSPLPKRYGWGVHSNSEGKIAIYAMESNEYKKLAKK
jgi:hypothetical protein